MRNDNFKNLGNSVKYYYNYYLTLHIRRFYQWVRWYQSYDYNRVQSVVAGWGSIPVWVFVDTLVSVLWLQQSAKRGGRRGSIPGWVFVDTLVSVLWLQQSAKRGGRRGSIPVLVCTHRVKYQRATAPDTTSCWQAMMNSLVQARPMRWYHQK